MPLPPIRRRNGPPDLRPLFRAAPPLTACVTTDGGPIPLTVQAKEMPGGDCRWEAAGTGYVNLDQTGGRRYVRVKIRVVVTADNSKRWP